MANDLASDEELQLYFNYLKKNDGLRNPQDFNTSLINTEDDPKRIEEFALEAV
jgi:hypothetical protein